MVSFMVLFMMPGSAMVRFMSRSFGLWIDNLLGPGINLRMRLSEDFFLLTALVGFFMVLFPASGRPLEIQWLGTAGFVLRSGNKTLLIDPYFPRNETARPFQPLVPEDFPDADAILISHGHFDHMKDVPEIVRKSNAVVYCSEKAGKTLLREGVLLRE